MRGSIGCPTRIVTKVPKIKQLARAGVSLSDKAKQRLEVLDWYYQKSAKYSITCMPNAVLTCRHFGIHRSQFYRWKKRYDKNNLLTLENKPTTPAHVRQPEYSRKIVDAMRALRQNDPTFSGNKARPILLRCYPESEVPSVATLGRLIRRENLFFRPDVKRHKKHAKASVKGHERRKKPYDLEAPVGGRLIEFDMKHVYVHGAKHYALCAIDVRTKEALIHTASSPSSRNATVALQKVIARFGTNIVVVNDWGSENMKDAEAYLLQMGIAQYWARPKHPKDKPHIERFIGTFQRECLDYNYAPMNVAELQEVTDDWLEKYHYYRPHQSLGYLTPAEFCAKISTTPFRTGVSYWV